MLNANEIIATAEAQVGLKDPETHLHSNLIALVDALNETALLSKEAIASTRKGLVGRTADRLEGLKWTQQHPEILSEQINEPVFLTGLPRSGTTYFQYLFDRDRRFRLIRSWESIMPSPPPGADPESVLRRKAIEAEWRNQSTPKIEGFEALHLMDDNGPDECHVYMEQSYSAAGFYNLHDVPTYFDFLMVEGKKKHKETGKGEGNGAFDFVPAYQVHKRQLQLLQWQTPQPRWALKYPNHVLAMDPIMQVYPDARFVMTHRDPLQVLASIAKMSFTLRSARQSGDVDAHRVGRQMLAFIRRHIDRIMAFCTGPNADRVTHVDYYRLVEDPGVLMKEIHAGIGVDTPDDVLASITSWRRENPKGKRGENKYSLDFFGIDADEARELFADYSNHFNIPSEAQGVAKSRAKP